MRFRPATPADQPAIRAIVFDALAEHGLRPEPDGADADLDDITGRYHAPGGVFDVIEDETGRVVGCAGLMPQATPGVCELRKMYLRPEARGRALGRALLERMIAAARARGFRRIELETAAVLERAVALYRAYGFRPAARAGHVARCDAVYALELEPT